MMRLNRISRYIVLGSFVALCTKRPSEEELAKLEEAKAAAESAERKLADLRRERMDLESQLQAKEDELRNHEAERDDLKEKMGK
jgi:septal ring factor EnvC (AmiA/AmiB activator)